MGTRLKSWLVLGIYGLATALFVVLIQPGSLHAQISAQPLSLVERISSFDIEQPEATAFAIWNASQTQSHEVWFRVMGGDALYQQRLRVYKEKALPRSSNILPSRSELAYEFEDNRPSDWYFLGSENDFHTYYFDGDNRPDSFMSWDNAKAVRAQRTIYRNGDLYEISFEDLNTLDDYNDLEIEVVLLHN